MARLKKTTAKTKEPDVLADAKKSGDKLVARVKGVQRVFTVEAISGDDVSIRVYNPDPDNSTYTMTATRDQIESPVLQEDQLQTT